MRTALRTLTTATLAVALAVGSVAAAPKRERPVNIYLSTGGPDGDCTPTVLTTRPVGQSSCGPVNPTGGSTTWTVDTTDEGFPVLAAGKQEAEVTIVIGDGLGIGAPGSWEITVDVALTGDFDLEASHTETFDASGGDMTIEFTIPIEAAGYIEGGTVRVTGSGAGLPVGYSVDGQGGSFIRVLPAPAA